MNKIWPGKFQFLASSRQFCQHINLHPISEQISHVYASEFLLLWCPLHCIPFTLSPHFSWDQQFFYSLDKFLGPLLSNFFDFLSNLVSSFLPFLLFPIFFSSAHSSRNSRHSKLFTKYVNDYSRELCLRPIYLFTIFKFYIDL